MAKYKICERCGSALDYGESCNCPPESLDTIQKKETVYTFPPPLPAPGSFVHYSVVDAYRKLEPDIQQGSLVQVLPKVIEARPFEPTYTTFIRLGPLWQYCGQCPRGSIARIN